MTWLDFAWRKVRWTDPGVLYACVALLCLGLLAFGFYLEHARGLRPCPLCITQRFFFAVVMLLSALGAYRYRARPGNHRVIGLLVMIFSLLGGAVAARQLWLQYSPAEAAMSCGPGLTYALTALPLNEAFLVWFRGDGNCSEVMWRFMGLSIPAWSLLFFVFFAGIAAYGLLRARPG